MTPRRYDPATVARLESRIRAQAETVRRLRERCRPGALLLAEAEGYLAWLQAKRDRPACRCGGCHHA